MSRITIGHIHFRTCSAEHFERAWFSLAKNLPHEAVERILVYDNNSGTPRDELEAVMAQWPVTPQPELIVDAHGNLERTHPYSVNRVIEQTATEWLFLTRSDYILAFDALAQLWDLAQCYQPADVFLTGWCFQSAYDRNQVDLPPVDIERTLWRRVGMPALTGDYVPGFCFHETDQDAGVWLARTAPLLRVGGLNEALSAWGYAQSTFQRALSHHGVSCEALPRYLMFHQHHGRWARDHRLARQQYQRYGGGQ